MKYLRYLVLSFAVLLLQSTLCRRLALGPARVDLVLAFVVYAGLLGNARLGALTGLWMGLLAGLAEPGQLGTEALLLTSAGFLAATTSPVVNRSHPLVQGILIAMLLLGHDLLRALLVYRFDLGTCLGVWASVSPASALYTAVLVPTALVLLPRLFPGRGRRAIS